MRTRRVLATTALFAAVLLILPLRAGSMMIAAKAEEVGLSTERLQRITEVVRRYIDAKNVAGAVTLVARRGKIAYFEAQGLADIEANKPMAKDSIFRLASMSKPITGVAIMLGLEVAGTDVALVLAEIADPALLR